MTENKQQQVIKSHYQLTYSTRGKESYWCMFLCFVLEHKVLECEVKGRDSKSKNGVEKVQA